MQSFNVSFLSDIEISSLITLIAISKEDAIQQALSMHSRGQLEWKYQNRPIGLYIGKTDTVWANPFEAYWTVSLSSRVSISAIVPDISAANENQAVEIAQSSYSLSNLPWTHGSFSIAGFSGILKSVWATVS